MLPLAGVPEDDVVLRKIVTYFPSSFCHVLPAPINMLRMSEDEDTLYLSAFRPQFPKAMPGDSQSVEVLPTPQDVLTKQSLQDQAVDTSCLEEPQSSGVGFAVWHLAFLQTYEALLGAM